MQAASGASMSGGGSSLRANVHMNPSPIKPPGIPMQTTFAQHKEQAITRYSAGVRYGTLRASVIQPLASSANFPHESPGRHRHDDEFGTEEEHSNVDYDLSTSSEDERQEEVFHKQSSSTIAHEISDAKIDPMHNESLSEDSKSIQDYVRGALVDELKKTNRECVLDNDEVFDTIVKVLTRSEIRRAYMSRKVAEAMAVANDLQSIVTEQKYVKKTTNSQTASREDKIVVDDVVMSVGVIIDEYIALKSKNVSLQQHVSSLRSELDLINQENQNLQLKVSDAERQRADVLTEIQIERERNIKHLQNIRTLSSNCDDYKRQLVHHKASNDQSQELREDLRQEIDEYKITKRTLEEELYRKTMEIQQLMEDNSKNAKQIVVLKTAIIEERAIQDGKLSSLTANMKELKEHNTKLSSSSDHAQSQNRTLIKEQSVTHKTLISINSMLAVAISKKATKDYKSIEEVTTTILSLENAIAMMEVKAIETCKSYEMQMKKYVQHVQNRVKEKFSSLQKQFLEKEMNHEQAIRDLKIEHAKRNDEKLQTLHFQTMKRTESKVRLLQEEHAKEVESLKSSLRVKREEIQNLKSKEHHLLSEKMILQDRCSEIEKKLEELYHRTEQGEINEAHKQNRMEADYSDKIKSITAKITVLEASLSDSKTSYDALKLEHDEVIEENRKLHTQLSNLNNHAVKCEEKVLCSLSLQQDQEQHIALLQKRENELQKELEITVTNNDSVLEKMKAELLIYQGELGKVMNLLERHKINVHNIYEAGKNVDPICESARIVASKISYTNERQSTEQFQMKEILAKQVSDYNHWQKDVERIGISLYEMMTGIDDSITFNKRVVDSISTHVLQKVRDVQQEISSHKEITHSILKTFHESSIRWQDQIAFKDKEIRSLQSTIDKIDTEKEEALETIIRENNSLELEKKELELANDNLTTKLQDDKHNSKKEHVKLLSTLSTTSKDVQLKLNDVHREMNSKSITLFETNSLLSHIENLITQLVSIVEENDFEKTILRKSFEEEKRHLCEELARIQNQNIVQQDELKSKIQYYQTTFIVGYENEIENLRKTIKIMQTRIGHYVAAKNRQDNEMKFVQLQLKQQQILRLREVADITSMKNELATVSDDLDTLKVRMVDKADYTQSLLLEYKGDNEESRQYLSEFSVEAEDYSNNLLQNLRLQYDEYIQTLFKEIEAEKNSRDIVTKEFRSLRIQLEKVENELISKDDENRYLKLSLKKIEQEKQVEITTKIKSAEEFSKQINILEEEIITMKEKNATSIESEERLEVKLMEAELSIRENILKHASEHRDVLAQKDTFERDLRMSFERKEKIQREIIEKQLRELDSERSLLKQQRNDFQKYTEGRDSEQYRLFHKQLSLCSSAVDKSYRYFKKMTSATLLSIEQFHDDVFVTLSSTRAAIQVLRRDASEMSQSLHVYFGVAYSESAGTSKNVVNPLFEDREEQNNHSKQIDQIRDSSKKKGDIRKLKADVYDAAESHFLITKKLKRRVV